MIAEGMPPTRCINVIRTSTCSPPNFAYKLFDGDGSDGPGSPAGPPGLDKIDLFGKFYGDRGLGHVGNPFNGGPDYEPFVVNGIPPVVCSPRPGGSRSRTAPPPCRGAQTHCRYRGGYYVLRLVEVNLHFMKVMPPPLLP